MIDSADQAADTEHAEASVIGEALDTIPSVENPAANVEPVDSQIANDEHLTDAIVTAGEAVGEAILQLENTLSALLTGSDTITATEIGFAIFVALVGALSAYLFNFFHWKTVSKREKLSGVGDALTRVIERLELTAVEYWLNDGKDQNRELERAREVSIKSKTRLVAKYVEIFVSGHKGKTRKVELQKLRDFKDQIFDVVTGGQFESRSRKASKPTAMKISNMCSDATALISSLDYHT